MASYSKEERTGCKAKRQHEEPRSCGDSDNDTKGCPDCQRTIPHIKQAFNSEKYVLSMHVEYYVLGQSGKKGNISTKQKVRSFTNEFFRNVCSLRNSRGGVLAIHVLGMDGSCGPSLDHFDEKVSKDLSNMIEDDSPYAYNYQRDWFHPVDDADAPQDTKYIVVVVKGSSAVSTKCFNTLVPFDGSKERPRAREVAKFLCDDIKYGTSNEKRNSITFKEGKHVDLIESRSVQFKSFSPRDLENDCKDNPDLMSKSLSEKLVFRLIEKLDLLQYLTAFTKLSNGGSFYLGIEEEKKKVPGTPKSSCRALDFNQDLPQPETEKDSRVGRGRRSVSKITNREADDRQKQSRTKSSTSDYRSRAGSDLERSRSRSRTTHERYSREHSTSRGSRGHKTTRRRSKERDSRDKYRDRRGRSPSRRQRYEPPPPLEMPRTESERGGRSSYRTLPHSPISSRRPEMSRQSSTVSVMSSTSAPGTSAPTRRPGTPVSPGHKEIKTGHNVVRGFEISESERTEMKKIIIDKISENMMWLKCDGDCINVSNILDFVDIIFHKCMSGGDSKYVLEIRVKRVFRGLVFFTKEGPEAYKLGDNGQTVSIPISEWMKLLNRAAKCASCIHGSVEDC